MKESEGGNWREKKERRCEVDVSFLPLPSPSLPPLTHSTLWPLTDL
jgi:hypothetical protein